MVHSDNLHAGVYTAFFQGQVYGRCAGAVCGLILQRSRGLGAGPAADVVRWA